MWEENCLHDYPTAKLAGNQSVTEEATKGVKDKTFPG